MRTFILTVWRVCKSDPLLCFCVVLLLTPAVALGVSVRPSLLPDPPLPSRLYVVPCSYGLTSRTCVFERAETARYSEEQK